jgi:nitroreductase
MEVKKAVAARQSIRAFKSDPIPQNVLEEIMEQALRSPSWGNTQPWKFTVVGGQALNKIREEYVRRVSTGVAAGPDFSPPESFNEPQSVRYKGLGRDLFVALGIARDDKEKRLGHYMNMYNFFGAPNIIYLHLEKGFHPYALMDGGIFLQTVALLAVEQGLGTCFLAVSVSYPDVVRQVAGLGEDQTLIMGLAIGYPVVDHPVNLFKSTRGKTEEFISWVE